MREMYRERKRKRGKSLDVNAKALDVNVKEDMEESGDWHFSRASRLCLPIA